MAKTVLFICIFNVKRSVVAEHFLRKTLASARPNLSERITVASAGYMGKNIEEWFHGNAIPFPEPLFNRFSPELIKTALLGRGIDISQHRSREATREILEGADLIIPILEPLKRDLISAYPEMQERIVLPEDFLENKTTFYWADTSVVPNDARMYDFAHGNKDYVTRVVNEIEEFIREAFPNIISRVLGEIELGA